MDLTKNHKKRPHILRSKPSKKGGWYLTSTFFYIATLCFIVFWATKTFAQYYDDPTDQEIQPFSHGSIEEIEHVPLFFSVATSSNIGSTELLYQTHYRVFEIQADTDISNLRPIVSFTGVTELPENIPHPYAFSEAEGSLGSGILVRCHLQNGDPCSRASTGIGHQGFLEFLYNNYPTSYYNNQVYSGLDSAFAFDSNTFTERNGTKYSDAPINHNLVRTARHAYRETRHNIQAENIYTLYVGFTASEICQSGNCPITTIGGLPGKYGQLDPDPTIPNDQAREDAHREFRYHGNSLSAYYRPSITEDDWLPDSTFGVNIHKTDFRPYTLLNLESIFDYNLLATTYYGETTAGTLPGITIDLNPSTPTASGTPPTFNYNTNNWPVSDPGLNGPPGGNLTIHDTTTTITVDVFYNNPDDVWEYAGLYFKNLSGQDDIYTVSPQAINQGSGKRTWTFTDLPEGLWRVAAFVYNVDTKSFLWSRKSGEIKQGDYEIDVELSRVPGYEAGTTSTSTLGWLTTSFLDCSDYDIGLAGNSICHLSAFLLIPSTEAIDLFKKTYSNIFDRWPWVYLRDLDKTLERYLDTTSDMEPITFDVIRPDNRETASIVLVDKVSLSQNTVLMNLRQMLVYALWLGALTAIIIRIRNIFT